MRHSPSFDKHFPLSDQSPAAVVLFLALSLHCFDTDLEALCIKIAPAPDVVSASATCLVAQLSVSSYRNQTLTTAVVIWAFTRKPVQDSN